MFVDENQCDQMTRLHVQYLAVQNMKNLPNSILICHSGFKILPCEKSSNPKIVKDLNNLSRWQNFAKSGHTEENRFSYLLHVCAKLFFPLCALATTLLFVAGMQKCKM